MATYHLKNWSITSANDPYLPPEAQRLRLHGLRVEDDKEVTTSYIVTVDGRNITTYSGSVYILEDIDPDYLQWLKDSGRTHDPDHPIKVIENKSKIQSKTVNEPKMAQCNAIVHPNIAPGWGCCMCRTYNGDQRQNCKQCNHSRCDINPSKKAN